MIRCSLCGAAKEDPKRDFPTLWFTRTDTGAGVCPNCVWQLVNTAILPEPCGEVPNTFAAECEQLPTDANS